MIQGIIVDSYSSSRNGETMIGVLYLKIDRIKCFRKNITNVVPLDQDLFC